MHISCDQSPKGCFAVVLVGKKIFDLSVVIRIRKMSMVFDLVSSICKQARANSMPVHILPEIQMHVTFVNPVFKMEGNDRQPVPLTDEQSRLYDELLCALRQSPARRLMSRLSEKELEFTDIRIGPATISLTGYVPEFTESQLQMERILRSQYPGFDFDEGHPFLHLTALRFLPEISKSNCERLGALVSEEAAQYPAILKYSILPNDFIAVRFDRLFMPWIDEARGAEFASTDAM